MLDIQASPVTCDMLDRLALPVCRRMKHKRLVNAVKCEETVQKRQVRSKRNKDKK